jgi:PST family polysaccharide transporter
MTMVVVAFGDAFGRFGVGQAIVQKDNLTEDFIRVSFTISCIIGVVIAAVVWFGAPLAGLLFDEPRVQPLLRMASLIFLVRSLGVVASSLLEKRLRFRQLSLIGITSYLVGYAALGALLAYLKFGAWAVVIAAIGQSLVQTLLYLFIQDHVKCPLLRKRELRSLLRYGGGITISTVFNLGANRGDYLVVGRALGAVSLGIYTRAYQLMTLPAIYFGQAIQSVTFPAMSQLKHENRRLVSLYLHAVAAISIATLPLSVFMLIVAPELIAVYLGGQWVDAIIPFQILACGSMFRAAYKVDHALANALGFVYHRGLREVVYFVAVLVGSWLGLQWGLSGVAAGVLIAITLNYLLAALMSLRLLKCSLRDFLTAHMPGLSLALVVAFASLPVTRLLRSLEATDFIIFGTTSVVTGIVVILSVFVYPRILGSYGFDVVNRVLGLNIFPETRLTKLARMRFQLVKPQH